MKAKTPRFNIIAGGAVIRDRPARASGLPWWGEGKLSTKRKGSYLVQKDRKP